jgi:hypothetical protein
VSLDEDIQVPASHSDGAAYPDDGKFARPDQGMHLGPAYVQLGHHGVSGRVGELK